MTLQPWQARRVHRALQPSVGYLSRLKARMLKVGFTQDDLLYQLVSQSYTPFKRSSCSCITCPARAESAGSAASRDEFPCYPPVKTECRISPRQNT